MKKLKMVRRYFLITKEQEEYILSLAREWQLNEKRPSSVIRKIIQSKMDEEKEKDKKEE